MPDFTAAIADLLPELVALRHDFHQHPELCFQERRTSARVVEELERIGGLRLRTGLAETGVVAVLNSGRPGPCVALRADMDALPLTEANDCAYRSRHEGRMHGCGHDGHLACLLGAARVLAACAGELPGKVKFIFQPAEEGGAGGQRMVEEGALDDPPVDAIFALHGWPETEFGHVLTGTGPVMAATGLFDLILTGKGTHAAYPHLGDDLVLAAAQITNALQALASRFNDPVEPVVVSVTSIHTGEAYNVLPDSAKLIGTVRALSTAGARRLEEQLRRTVEAMAAGFGIKAEVRFFGSYPATVNDARAAGLVGAVATEWLGAERVHADPPPTMGGEDFAYYAERVPAAFWRLGLRPPDAVDYPQLHHPEFDFRDDALPIGTEMHCRLAHRFLNQGW